MDIAKKIITVILIVAAAYCLYTASNDIEQKKVVREMKEAVEEYGLEVKNLTICDDSIKICVPSCAESLTEEDLALADYVNYAIPNVDIGKSIHLFITDSRDNVIFEKNYGYPAYAPSAAENTMEEFMDETLLKSKLAFAFNDADIECVKWKETTWSPWTLTSLKEKEIRIGDEVDGRVINFLFNGNTENKDVIKACVSDTVSRLNEEGACIVKYGISVRENGNIILLESTDVINGKTVKLK